MFMFVYSFIFLSVIDFTIECVWKRMKIDWRISKHELVYQSMQHAGGAFVMKMFNRVHENRKTSNNRSFYKLENKQNSKNFVICK